MKLVHRLVDPESLIVDPKEKHIVSMIEYTSRGGTYFWQHADAMDQDWLKSETESLPPSPARQKS
jgi:hypothetical protein